mgnify:CR=1 FL=1
MKYSTKLSDTIHILIFIALGDDEQLSSTKIAESIKTNPAYVRQLMATLKKPRLLLLDEHTAALDPKTAAKVLDITEKIVDRDHLTTLMITHNMKDAIAHGNRLIMMHEGRVIYDVSGEEKKKLQVSDLLKKFEQASGGEFANDRMMLN